MLHETISQGKVPFASECCLTHGTRLSTCSRAQFDPHHADNRAIVRGCCTSAAEQLWSRTDKLVSFAMHFNRCFFRSFMRRYCVWRNAYIRSGMRLGASPLTSRKQKVRRGDWVSIGKRVKTQFGAGARAVAKKPSFKRKRSSRCL